MSVKVSMAINVPIFVKRKHMPNWPNYGPNNKWHGERPFGRWFTNIRARAKKKGLGFDLDPSWLLTRLKATGGKCEQTGIKLSPPNNGPLSPWSTSLDRIDSSKGYTKDNVQIVCWSYNVAKSTFTDAVVLEMAKAMILHQYPDSQ
mgnify:CR=1 FL=1